MGAAWPQYQIVVYNIFLQPFFHIRMTLKPCIDFICEWNAFYVFSVSERLVYIWNNKPKMKTVFGSLLEWYRNLPSIWRCIIFRIPVGSFSSSLKFSFTYMHQSVFSIILLLFDTSPVFILPTEHTIPYIPLLRLIKIINEDKGFPHFQ